jgi:hypothetical protein
LIFLAPIVDRFIEQQTLDLNGTLPNVPFDHLADFVDTSIAEIISAARQLAESEKVAAIARAIRNLSREISGG